MGAALEVVERADFDPEEDRFVAETQAVGVGVRARLTIAVRAGELLAHVELREGELFMRVELRTGELLMRVELRAGELLMRVELRAGELLIRV